MAKIIRFDKEAEAPVNQSLVEPCEQLGITFGCQNGLCGTCLVDILSGAEFLTPVNEDEELMGIAHGQRLACQCKITNKDAVIKIR